MQLKIDVSRNIRRVLLFVCTLLIVPFIGWFVQPALLWLYAKWLENEVSEGWAIAAALILGLQMSLVWNLPVGVAMASLLFVLILLTGLTQNRRYMWSWIVEWLSAVIWSCSLLWWTETLTMISFLSAVGLISAGLLVDIWWRQRYEK